MHDYDSSLGNLEMFSASAEWSSMMQAEAMGMTQIPETSDAPTKTGWVAPAIVTSLFFVSLTSLTFSSIKIAEGVSNLYQPLASMQMGSR